MTHSRASSTNLSTDFVGKYMLADQELVSGVINSSIVLKRIVSLPVTGVALLGRSGQLHCVRGRQGGKRELIKISAKALLSSKSIIIILWLNRSVNVAK